MQAMHSSRVAHVPNNLYSSQASQQLGEATLVGFKRAIAVRQEFERCDGIDLLYHQR